MGPLHAEMADVDPDNNALADKFTPYDAVVE
jgi:hypothetical protein